MSCSVLQDSWSNSTDKSAIGAGVPSTLVLINGIASLSSVVVALTVANGTNPVNVGLPFVVAASTADRTVFISASCQFGIDGQTTQPSLKLEAFVSYSGTPPVPGDGSCGDATILSPVFPTNGQPPIITANVLGRFPCSIIGGFQLPAGNIASIQLRATTSLVPTTDTSLNVSGLGAICFTQE